MKKLNNNLLYYDLSDEVEAFSTLRGARLPYPVLQPHQTHGTNIRIIEDERISRDELEDTDALITSLKNFAIGVRTADCIPVLMYDTKQSVIAAVHSGWKGTVRKVTSLTIRRMQEAFGSSPFDIIAQIGPGIGPDSFQVGQEVVDSFSSCGFPMDRIFMDMGIPTEKFSIVPGTDITSKKSPMEGGFHINLWEANKWILEMEGIKEIKCSSICTYVRNDIFYSARRETISCPRIINSIKII